MAEITNSDDVIDSREVTARIDELTSELTTCEHCGEDIRETDNPNREEYERTDDLIPGDVSALFCAEAADGEHYPEADNADDAREELRQLQEFAKEGECYDGWDSGIPFYRETYMKNLAQEEVEEELGEEYISRWPLNQIDWEEAADHPDFQGQFSELDFNGVTYFTR